ncbi:MAG: DNA internalization-related competence protein ComEC/Rec2 [Fuerstiella sp.]
MPAKLPESERSGRVLRKINDWFRSHLCSNQSERGGSFRALAGIRVAGHALTRVFVWPRLPLSGWTAVALVGGIVLGSVVPPVPLVLLAASLACLFAAAFFRRRNPRACSVLCVLTAIVLLGAVRWQLHQGPSARTSLKDFCGDGPVTLTLRGHIASVPAVHVRPSSSTAPRLYGSAEQSRFLVSATSVITSTGERDIGGNYQVYVDGDITGVLHSGDEVMLTGRWDWPGPPGNPGEFDYEQFLTRRQIFGLFFVKHPAAIRVVTSCSRWSPGYWVSELRQKARSVLVTAVPDRVRGIALALLLGNRHQLPSETEDAFIGSGTMHLLAISGLHVGILCAFLLSICHLLIIRRSWALLLTAAVCIIYAMLTDLRPSVLRATVFFVIFVIAQLVRRNQSIVSLLSVTAIIMVSAQPHLVFDTGAWLSFLSVAALGWVSGRRIPDDVHHDAPADALSAGEKLRDMLSGLSKRLAHRLQQMLSILALTTPLVAATFHVISPVGVIVNVLLIPLTALTLCAGFVLLAAGMLHPSLAHVAGPVFSWLLTAMTRIVEATSSLHLSHVYVADVPEWFLPLYYVLVPTILLIRWRPLKRIAVLGLYCSIAVAFFAATQPNTSRELRCTVLDVGHGSAAVLEFPTGEVFLVDGGALNRGERTADLICRYLWHRGYRSLNGILISHADADHYNAVSGILKRIPVSELLTSRDFVTSDSASVQSVIQLAGDMGTPVRILHNGDSAQMGMSFLRCVQPDLRLLPQDADDNEKSLVVVAEHAGRRIVLPGDLEGSGSRKVFLDVGPTDVLISPHHGSPTANTAVLAGCLTPDTVIVSARSSVNADRLRSVFGEAALFYTSDFGAVSVSIAANGRLSVTPWRDL